ncbi:uncharacterized protein LOC135561540 [Oncorhynchus nerka]|uniref:uncharacterized protein LOC135561540 n=1 Tax=Oncorhynchus nerka TaxID=8023 RepID=UPI0031B83E7F
MDRLCVALITFLRAVSSSQDGISAAEVELRVRPGDNVVLHCDIKDHLVTDWHRNSSVGDGSHFRISKSNPVRRFYFLVRSQQFYDLLITNVSESDLGLYYCGSWQKLVVNKEGFLHDTGKDVYYHGNVITRLSFETRPTEPSSPDRDCGLCWMLLFSLCPVSALLSSLLSSTCVYFFCRTTAPTETQDPLNRTTTRGSESREKEEGDLCYASLDIRQGQRRPKKKKTTKNSDFSTYSAINTSRVCDLYQSSIPAE